MWRLLHESVAGTSHNRAGTPCQDAHAVTPYSVGDRTFLIAACSDGAGSASHSQMGSQLACSIAVDSVTRYLEATGNLSSIDRSVASAWIDQIRAALADEAGRLDVDVRQIACTLLLAVIGEGNAVFLQLGDGAMVVRKEAVDASTPYEVVFWPQNGEYANTTFFLTDAVSRDVFLFERREVSVAELSAFTDGVQVLALNYAARQPHRPFFLPFFRSLAGAEDPSDLVVPFRAFLDSDAVNTRTDDDKTLVLAQRNATKSDVIEDAVTEPAATEMISGSPEHGDGIPAT